MAKKKIDEELANELKNRVLGLGLHMSATAEEADAKEIQIAKFAADEKKRLEENDNSPKMKRNA